MLSVRNRQNAARLAGLTKISAIIKKDLPDTLYNASTNNAEGITTRHYINLNILLLAFPNRHWMFLNSFHNFFIIK